MSPLDTIEIEASIPEDKLVKCRALIREFLPRKTVTLTELQSFIGLLNFIYSAIVPGRTFLRRLINLTVEVKHTCQFIRLNRDTKAYLRLWLTFLESFNGKSFFLDYIWLSSAKRHLYTDAAGSLGYGPVCGARWFFGPWPHSLIWYRQMHQRLRTDYGLVADRETVRTILKTLHPDGVERRSKRKLKRRKYHSKGPNNIWQIDGYDKLKPFGFCIHGAIDGYSRRILWLEVGSSNNNPLIVRKYFLDCVVQVGELLGYVVAMPVQKMSISLQ